VTEVREVELKGLRALRRSRGMRQEDLAEAIGSDQYSVSQWERGVRSPRPTTIKKLGEALGVKPQDLFIEQPIAVPLAEPAPVEEVAALLRIRCGTDLLVVDEDELVIRAMDPATSVEEMMDDLYKSVRAADAIAAEGGISREMRAALKHARGQYNERLKELLNAGVRKKQAALESRAERLMQEANVTS
jgi:transcriptional regulator with XRE-family HTH domain